MESAALAQIAEVAGGRLVRGNSAAEVKDLVTDTREDCRGDLFVPLKGERFDGHDFIAEAAGKGAAGCLSERDVSLIGLPREFAVIRVADALKAYQALARWNRLMFTVPVVAVTGSCGKTTTKEMIKNIFEVKEGGGIVFSRKNENNEIGVPKALLRMDAGTRGVVLEFGMRGSGEVALLTDIAQPDCGVITNIERVHIGRLGSEEAIADAKG
ncbi:MAG: UDP-N-acetylmuramoyl-tripeptide--D-alanyl-D-alanine ligase, partial [bacterium]